MSKTLSIPVLILCLTAMLLPLFAEEKTPADIEYRKVSVPLDEGKYLTPDAMTKALFRQFGLVPPPEMKIKGKGLDLSGLKGFIAVKSVSLAFGDSASVYKAGSNLIIKYKKEDAEKVKQIVTEQLAAGMIKLFGGAAERALIPDFRAYGVYPIGNHEEGREPILLVHGLDSSAADFTDLARYLGETGKWNLFVFQYKNDQSIHKSATELSFRIAKIPSDSITIITKSMGGLVVREYLTNSDLYRKNVKRLLMVTPPNHGSNLARLRFVLDLGEGFTLIQKEKLTFRETLTAIIGDGLGKAGDDMEPGSLFLDRLSARSMPEGLVYGIIAGDVGLLTETQHKQLAEWLEKKGAGISSPYAKMAFAKLRSDFDACEEIIMGKGDMAVTLKSAKLKGAAMFSVVHRNHLDILSDDGNNPVLEMIRDFIEGKKLKSE